eukprot:PhM_4_TR4490/c0_g1_i1/m.62756
MALILSPTTRRYRTGASKRTASWLAGQSEAAQPKMSLSCSKPSTIMTVAPSTRIAALVGPLVRPAKGATSAPPGGKLLYVLGASSQLQLESALQVLASTCSHAFWTHISELPSDLSMQAGKLRQSSLVWSLHCSDIQSLATVLNLHTVLREAHSFWANFSHPVRYTHLPTLSSQRQNVREPQSIIPFDEHRSLAQRGGSISVSQRQPVCVEHSSSVLTAEHARLQVAPSHSHSTSRPHRAEFVCHAQVVFGKQPTRATVMCPPIGSLGFLSEAMPPNSQAMPTDSMSPTSDQKPLAWSRR